MTRGETQGTQGAKRRLTAVVGCLLLCFGMVAASSASAAAAVLRGGEHDAFSRLVFDWRQPVDYRVTRDGERLTIVFTAGKGSTARDGGLDLLDVTDLGKAALTRISDAQSQTGPDGLILTARVGETARLRHFREGTRIVLDVLAPAPIEERKPDIAVAEPAPPAAPELPIVPEPPVKPEPPAIAPQPPVKPEPLAAAAPAPLRYSGAPIVVQYEPVFNGVRLSYPLPEPAAAAVFQRAGHLWLVIETYRPLDHGTLTGAFGERIRAVEQIPHPNATIVRYRIGSGQHAVVHRRDGTWIIELKDNRTPPRMVIPVTQQEDGGRSLFLPVADVGSRIDINDPEVGDQLAVVPVLAPGRGLLDDRRFAEFKLLATAQGIAMELYADGLDLARYRNGVGLGATGGLALSKTDETENEVGMAATRPRRLVDFEGWRRGPVTDHLTIQQGLLHRLSLADEAERDAVRWDLARFHLAHGAADRALGILDVMVADDAAHLDNPEFRAARGIAHIVLRRFQEARNDLAHQGLGAEADAHLWRAVAAEGLGQWQEALDHYRRGVEVLADYEERDRARFKLAALRAAAALGDTALMADEIDILSGYLLPPHMMAEVEFLRGRMLKMAGDPAAAHATFAKVMVSGDRQSAARARLAKVNIELADKKIGTDEAVEQLERLRFAWRGDSFELDLLDRLGRLYIGNGEHRTGLMTLQQAVTHFGNSPRTRALSEAMSDAFRSLFLDGEADAMPPVQALSLYYDFRELTPLGADGDNMIRRLADRLVAVDLLDRAAELLEHQVRYRLEGVAQATVAGRLAMIYLMDRKPDKALAVMRATRQTAMPQDIEDGRRHLEARALIDLRRFEEAEVMLEADRSHVADLLRADLYWTASRWPDVVTNGEKLLGQRWQQPKALSADERRQVLRLAVALSLDENVEGLKSLRHRYRELMEQGAYASAFDVITAKQDPSAKEIKELTESIASVNVLESFMTAYREEFRGS